MEVVEVRVPATPTRRDWVTVLGELAAQVGDGRVHDRDVAAVSEVISTVLAGIERRTPFRP